MDVDTEVQRSSASSPLSPAPSPSPVASISAPSFVLPAIAEPIPDADATSSPSKRIPAPLNLAQRSLPSFESLGFDSVNIQTPYTPFTRLSKNFDVKQSGLRDTLDRNLSVPSLSIQLATPLVPENTATIQPYPLDTNASQDVPFEIDPQLTTTEPSSQFTSSADTQPSNISFAPLAPTTPMKGMPYGNVSSARDVLRDTSPSGRSYTSHSPHRSPYRHMNDRWDPTSIAPTQMTISRSPSPYPEDVDELDPSDDEQDQYMGGGSGAGSTLDTPSNLFRRAMGLSPAERWAERQQADVFGTPAHARIPASQYHSSAQAAYSSPFQAGRISPFSSPARATTPEPTYLAPSAGRFHSVSYPPTPQPTPQHETSDQPDWQLPPPKVPSTPPRQIRTSPMHYHTAPAVGYPADSHLQNGYYTPSYGSSPGSEYAHRVDHTVTPGTFNQWGGDARALTPSPAAGYSQSLPQPVYHHAQHTLHPSRSWAGYLPPPDGRNRLASPARTDLTDSPDTMGMSLDMSSSRSGMSLDMSSSRSPSSSLRPPRRGRSRSYTDTPTSRGSNSRESYALSPSTPPALGAVRPGTVHGKAVRANPLAARSKGKGAGGLALNQYAQLTPLLMYPCYEGAVRQMTPIVVDTLNPVLREYSDKRGFWDDNSFWTWDSSVKVHSRCIRICAQCHTDRPGAKTWRRSHVQEDTSLCNKCGIYEHTHGQARPHRPGDAERRYKPHKRIETFNYMITSRPRAAPKARSPSPKLKLEANPVFGGSFRMRNKDEQAASQFMFGSSSRLRKLKVDDEDEYRPGR